MKDDKLTVETICGGAVQERINRAIAKVVENILDPNTDAKKKRSITLKLTFVANEDDREDVAVGAEVTVSLASEEGVTTQMFVSRDPVSKKITVSEYEKGNIKGQMSLDDLGMLVKNDAGPTAEELGCDPETGEIIQREDLPGVVDFRKTAVNG